MEGLGYSKGALSFIQFLFPLIGKPHIIELLTSPVSDLYKFQVNSSYSID